MSEIAALREALDTNKAEALLWKGRLLERNKRTKEALADAEKRVRRLEGTLEYIRTQARLRPSGDDMTLRVIIQNASAALGD